MGWIRKGYLKKETEGLTFTPKERALRTNWIERTPMAKRYQKKVECLGKR